MLDRRALLVGGALGVAGGRGAHAMGRGPDIAMATICCDGFGDEDFVHSFAAMPKLGVANVEFNVWYPQRLLPAGLDSIKRRCRRAGLRPVSLQPNGFATGEGGDLTREVSRLLWIIEGCKRLGCSMIKITGEARGSRGGLAGIIEVVKAVAPAAEEAKVSLNLENHFKNNLETIEDYDRVFSAIDSKAVGVAFDMAHFTASGVDMHAFIARFFDRIRQVDIKDCKARGDAKFVRYGTGITPIDAVLADVMGRGYRGQLVVELSLIDRATMMDDLRAGMAIARKWQAHRG